MDSTLAFSISSCVETEPAHLFSKPRPWTSSMICWVGKCGTDSLKSVTLSEQQLHSCQVSPRQNGFSQKAEEMYTFWSRHLDESAALIVSKRLLGYPSYSCLSLKECMQTCHHAVDIWHSFSIRLNWELWGNKQREKQAESFTQTSKTQTSTQLRNTRTAWNWQYINSIPIQKYSGMGQLKI